MYILYIARYSTFFLNSWQQSFLDQLGGGKNYFFTNLKKTETLQNVNNFKMKWKI